MAKTGEAARVRTKENESTGEYHSKDNTAKVIQQVEFEAPSAFHERLINSFARVTQFLTWPILFVVFHLFFGLKIRGRENFRLVKHPFIIISNHISFYDSFLFRLILGAWTPHLPLRFMAVKKFEWRFLNFLASIGVIDFIYSLFGVFTIVPGRGIKKNLGVAKKIIEVGGDVVIYPEGRIFVTEEDSEQKEGIGPFKKGAAVLMRETGVPVIPVAFHVRQSWLRRKIFINVGNPLHGLGNMTPEEITDLFRGKVADLYWKE